jgi:hypothetical protein
MTLPLTPVRIKDLGVRVSGSKVGFIVMISPCHGFQGVCGFHGSISFQPLSPQVCLGELLHES